LRKWIFEKGGECWKKERSEERKSIREVEVIRAERGYGAKRLEEGVCGGRKIGISKKAGYQGRL